ncbi:MAG: LysM domain-containing protein [Acidimicrobiia bacterium]
MASESFLPFANDFASLYLVVLLGLSVLWFVGDRIWVLALGIATPPPEGRPRRHRRSRTASIVASALIGLMSWRLLPAAASVVPQRERVMAVSEETGSALTLRSVMVDDPQAVQPATGSDASPTRLASRVPPMSPTRAGSYMVVSGDCLWSIARSILMSESDRGAVSGAEISDLWHAIYDLNREVIGDNPNLIFPGQVFVLPER